MKLSLCPEMTGTISLQESSQRERVFLLGSWMAFSTKESLILAFSLLLNLLVQ
jgi:hypothetical protein